MFVTANKVYAVPEQNGIKYPLRKRENGLCSGLTFNRNSASKYLQKAYAPIPIVAIIRKAKPAPSNAISKNN